MHERRFFWISKPRRQQLRLDISHCRARDEAGRIYNTLLEFFRYPTLYIFCILVRLILVIGILEPASHCIPCESLDREAGMRDSFHSSCWPDCAGDVGGDIGADQPEYRAHKFRAAVTIGSRMQ